MTTRRQKGALFALCSAFWLAAACGSSGGSGFFGAPGRSCVTAADCDRDAPLCGANGVCVECVAPADCGGGDVCDALSGKCSTACATAADCTSNGVCAARGVCVECATNADCAARDGQICNMTAGVCVGCRSDSDCGGTHPFCNAASSQCETCRVTADCAPNQTCQGGDCVTHCASNADCGGGAPACLVDTGACVECASDTDCSADKPGCVLSEHRCRDCSSDAQCTDGKQCDLAKGQCQ
jgi:Cys-rich repeat protein